MIDHYNLEIEKRHDRLVLELKLGTEQYQNFQIERVLFGKSVQAKVQTSIQKVRRQLKIAEAEGSQSFSNNLTLSNENTDFKDNKNLQSMIKSRSPTQDKESLELNRSQRRLCSSFKKHKKRKTSNEYSQDYLYRD